MVKKKDKVVQYEAPTAKAVVSSQYSFTAKAVQLTAFGGKSIHPRLKSWFSAFADKSIRVYYHPDLHGGGMDFGQDFLKEVKEKFGKVDSLCEFACGPGFIGFSLLAHGLCKKLCLIDINPKAIKVCIKTIKANGIQDVCTTYVSDGLSEVPKKEKWDLVVSNPPMFNGTENAHKKDLLGIDPNWRIHKEFYKNVHKHLNQDGSALFVESLNGSNGKFWKKMIVEAGLEFVGSYQKKQNLLKLLKKLVKIILAINLDDIKNNFKIYQKNKDISALTSKIYSTYFVWSKKADRSKTWDKKVK